MHEVILKWQINCGKEDRDIALLILSVLHAMPIDIGRQMAKDICFIILPTEALGRIVLVHPSTTVIVFKTEMRKKGEKGMIKGIAHELGQYLEGHHKKAGEPVVMPEIEKVANKRRDKILKQFYFPGMKRLLELKGDITLKEYFSKIYGDVF